MDPVTVSQWGLTALKWLREIPETVKSWGQSRPRYPAVSVVPVQHPMYSESAQPDGTIVTQIMMDCLVTNGREDHSLLIARTECHVRSHGTVQGLPIPIGEEILLKRSAEMRFIFHFSRALNNPRGFTVILTDQFGHKHKQWIRLHYGRPYDPF
jgi:hypothetical protein